MRDKNYMFSGVPVIRHPRSRFDLSHSIKTSGSIGYLYPFELQEVLPGDTFKVNTSFIARTSTNLLKPVMDNVFIDIYYFFVPSRLVYNDFPCVFGENRNTAWAPATETVIPTLSTGVSQKLSTSQSGGNRQVGCCFGLPLNTELRSTITGVYSSISVLPFRAFALIYDEWFRDENLVPPMQVKKDNSTTGQLNTSAWGPSNYTGKVPKVAKMHDYFTSCLPAPQKGAAVDIPLELTGGSLPVVPSNNLQSYSDIQALGGQSYPNLIWNFGTGSATSVPANSNYRLFVRNTGSSSSPYLYTQGESVSSISGFSNNFFPINLRAVANGNAFSSGMSVNDLRFAFAFQKILERSARTGSRYTEYIAAAYGISAGDARLQRSEFLGGKRSPINVQQVVQTTGSPDFDDNSANYLGQVAATSLSAGKSHWTKSFTEHGYVIGVYCIRQFHTYQQGVAPLWFRKKQRDFYDPCYANIGEQPVYKKYIYADGLSIGDDSVFGYQEAWADYRMRHNMVSGQAMSKATNSLDMWHLADLYNISPTLSKDFIEETDSLWNRICAVDSSELDQFVIDFYVQNIAVRPLPTYSVPGLIDHG